MDPRRLSAAPEENQFEIWHIKNGGNGWSHPVHVHFEEGQVLRRGGVTPPIWEQFARKDVYRIGLLPDSTDSVDIVIRFREFVGTYMEHCHNTQHEDHAMLLRWDVQNPGQTIALPTPSPDWEGVLYEDTFELDTAHTGDLQAAMDFQAPPRPGPEPGTDTVTIDRARLQSSEQLRVTGSVSLFNNAFAPNIEVFTGLSDGTSCPGTSLGTTAVNAGSGDWSFSAGPPPAETTAVCVQSANGGVADATL